ncbi:MAG TPA: hypothetical protein VFM18_11675 [Methanosarcina sp.]|nr:hypothetical protein [Methanosarcina sp.]
MLDIKNKVISNLNGATGIMARFIKMKSLLDAKCAANLRLLATKNNLNRASDYHYLNLAVTQSTEPVNGIDYIHPVVKPTVDYASAVITKGLAQNGEINFEFIADNEADEAAARQATNMVHKILNQNNDPHTILQHWVMDACLHKNGEMMISPMRESFVRYVTTQGTLDQLKAFEQQAADAGYTAMRKSRRKKSVDLAQVSKETAQFSQTLNQQQRAADLDARIQNALSGMDGNFDEMNNAPDNVELSTGEDAIAESIARNTVYEAEYKLTGYNLNIKFRPIAQHYWLCDPTVISIEEQPFCGFYKPMSVQEATELYPDINLEEFMIYAQYSNVGSYQAGSLLNNLAIHARDSVPINGLPAQGYSAQEPEARQVTVQTIWNRYDIDGDGELELIELIYSGQYIISAREVEFIPVANMVPKPLPQNFYGMSIAESVVPMQEYMTSGHRSEIALGLQVATPRIGVKPDKLDFEQLQDGESAIFILDSKFNPQTDIYQLPPPSGDIGFIDNAMNRLQQDTMAMIGMTTPQDVFNPQVMEPGNSGAKLQLALSPNQINQDNTVKNAAEGLKDAIWLIWRTLIAFGDDYGVKKLAQEFHPDGLPVFLDYQAFDDMNFNERKTIHIDLALGMKSEENSLQRLQIIKQAQTGMTGEITAMAQSNTLTPAAFKKSRKPYEDMLYVLGVKDADSYLPTMEEATEMIKQGQQAAQQKADQAAQMAKQASDADLAAKTAKTNLDTVKAQQIQAEVAGNTASKQLEGYALLHDHVARPFGD